MEDSKVKDLLNRFQTEDKGYIEEEGFLRFYLNSAIDKTTTVWSNLTNMGYGPQLTRVPIYNIYYIYIYIYYIYIYSMEKEVG